MHCKIKFLLYIWLWIKACIYEFTVRLKQFVSRRTGREEGQKTSPDDTVANTVGRNRATLNVLPNPAVHAIRYRQFSPFAFLKGKMARPKNPQRSVSLSEDVDSLFEMQREISTRAFDYISRALQIDESTQG
jgi:hypothetical protein